MFSIRNDHPRSAARGPSRLVRRALVAAALAGLVPAVGCAKYKQPVAPANNPTDVDPAMAYRNWPSQDAVFANSTLTTFRNRFPFDDYNRTQNQSQYAGVIMSPLYFFGQTLFLPISLIINPPGAKQQQTTFATEPTFTASPSRPEAAPDVVEKAVDPNAPDPEGTPRSMRKAKPTVNPSATPDATPAAPSDPGTPTPAPAGETPGVTPAPVVPAPDATPAPTPAPAQPEPTPSPTVPPPAAEPGAPAAPTPVPTPPPAGGGGDLNK